MSPTVNALPGCLPLRQWADLLRHPPNGVYRALAQCYGDDASLLREKAFLCLRAVEKFASEFGVDREVFIVRSTGRVNLMGMHIDHRGGFVHPIAVHEVFFVAGARDDDLVRLTNAEESLYADAVFAIARELPPHRIEDWDTWTHHEHQRRVRAGQAGHWSNYAKAAVLYLQHRHTTSSGRFAPALKGMDVAVMGNIPPAAGLSSSSALVVGFAEACLHRNRIAMSPRDLVDLCGAAEWYVGTRGGQGDHAAIKFGRRGHILHIGSFPLSVESFPLPPGYAVILTNSCIEARKQVGARDIFNERVAAYELGLLLLRRNYPEHAPRMEHLRDVNPRILGVSEQEIYRMIRSLPECATRDEIRHLLRDRADHVERILRTHAEPRQGYRIRQVVMYGIAECIRSEMAAEMLRQGDVAGFGEIMNISHDGDRVSRLVRGQRVPVDNSLPDIKIDRLIADLESGDPQLAKGAALWRQPGGYDVSTPELDTIVDLARAVPGTVGAGRVGAGLGGACVVLVREDQAGQVMQTLIEGYYRPRNLEPACEIVAPVGGAGVLIPA